LGPIIRRRLKVIMSNVASICASQGRLNEALEVQAECVEIAKKVVGPDHRNTLQGMIMLAAIYLNLGRLREGVKVQEDCLQIQKKLEPEHPDTLISMGNLASAYEKLGWFDKAAKVQGHCLEIEKKVLGTEHPYTLTNNQYEQSVIDI
jgi:hypothetical protein